MNSAPPRPPPQALQPTVNLGFQYGLHPVRPVSGRCMSISLSYLQIIFNLIVQVHLFCGLPLSLFLPLLLILAFFVIRPFQYVHVILIYAILKITRSSCTSTFIKHFFLTKHFLQTTFRILQEYSHALRSPTRLQPCSLGKVY
jgi:hypothetical protein